MKLHELGWTDYQHHWGTELNETVARVAVEHKTNYVLYTENRELQGIVRGNFLKTGNLPKVGDWVTIELLPGENKAIITGILPRLTKIARKAKPDSHEEQIITTNVNVVFIVHSLETELDINQIERYVLMAREGGVKPVVILNKADTSSDPGAQVAAVRTVLGVVAVYAVSAKTGHGLDHIRALIRPGTSVAFVGPSGAGKSTVINALLGSNRQKTSAVGKTHGRGKHTTTRREMIILPDGGVLIDTPGIRELEVLSAEDAVGETFTDFKALAEQCQFRNCDHEKSAGCAIRGAMALGTVSEKRYRNYLQVYKPLTKRKYAKR